jgi:hypothetical protein
METVELTEKETGLMTLGLPTSLVEAVALVHRAFLAAHNLDYWRLIVIQIPWTRHVLVFSGGPANDEEPDYTLTDADRLTKRIGEILTAHYEQHIRRVAPASSH